jgi:hypothetical protein
MIGRPSLPVKDAVMGARKGSTTVIETLVRTSTGVMVAVVQASGVR